jgi:hypothetical protein
MNTLEREFHLTQIRHKGAILMAKIMEYYRDKEEKKQGVKIPDCIMVGMWQRQAYKDIRNILLQPYGEDLFNKLYESAWHELKERLP